MGKLVFGGPGQGKTKMFSYFLASNNPKEDIPPWGKLK